MLIHFLVQPFHEERKPSVALQQALEALKGMSESSIGSLSNERTHAMQANPLAEEFWSQAGAGDVDVLVLRFLRARKWNVYEAFGMLTECLRWRRSFGVRRILIHGESAIKTRLLESGESFFWKHDKAGRLTIVMRGRLHERTAQTLTEMMAFTVYQIETGRRLMPPSTDTVTLLFDLGDAPLSSFDYASIQFMVQCLQSFYPESLGRCFILNAPWVFSGFWRFIRPLLDPVVAQKIVFVRKEQLGEHFDTSSLLSWYGGEDGYEYKYLAPADGDSHLDALSEDEWNALQRTIELEKTRLIDLTLQASLLAGSDEGDIKARRDAVKQRLHAACKRVDQHSFARTHYHRLGVIDDQGNADWSRARYSSNVKNADAIVGRSGGAK